MEWPRRAWTVKATRSRRVPVFPWIKQHLRIKRFFGASENAVKSQIWIAVLVYVLVAIIKKRLNLDASLYMVLKSFSIILFEEMPLEQAFSRQRLQIRTGQRMQPTESIHVLTGHDWGALINSVFNHK